MRTRTGLAVLIAFSLVAAATLAGQAPNPPAWAYPVMDAGLQRAPEDGKKYRVEGSDKSFTMTEINDPFNPPDWYPNEHPPMPPTVAHGRKPNVRACGQCHMPHGLGHPESSGLAGLSANYIVQQMADYKSGKRKSLVAARSASMIAIAADATDAEVREAAAYFASIKATKWIRVVETDTVPETYVGFGNMRHAKPGGGREPIGQRIIEIPENSEHAELRDSHSSFVAYVPAGSVKRGETLSTTGGGGKTVACNVCHGPGMKGLGDMPALAGRSPIYLVRQMMDIKHGSRQGPGAGLMTGVVARLTDDDMLDIAAYLSSLEP